MENGGDNEKKSGGFYTYRGKKDGKQAETAVPGDSDAEAEKQEPAEPEPAGQELADREPAGKPEDFPVDAAQARAEKRVKTLAWALAALLAAAALIAVILNPGVIMGAAPADTAKPASSHKAKPAWTGGTDAAMFLYSQNWDDKKHSSMQSLKKVKNLRYALQFFQNYTPEQAAAVPALPGSLTDVAQNYGDAVGSFVDIEAKVGGKNEVSEDLEPGTGGPPCVLALPGDPSYGGASLLVLGPLDGIAAGDTIKCKCIPVYFYSPKDNPAAGGLLLVTIPQLVYKQK